jgi:hypothetical protein
MAFLEVSVGKMKKGLDTVARRIVIEIGSRLELRSPVGNPNLWKSLPPPGYVGGAFRRNWQHGFGSAPTAILEGTGNTSGQEIRASVNSSPAGGVHYIVNNLPYAMALEDGHSTQSPPRGMVGLTALEFPEIVRQAQG